MLKLDLCYILKFWNYDDVEKMKSPRRGPENDEDPRNNNKNSESFDMNLISIKNHEMEM